MEIEERIAVLEERTKPDRKTFFDHLKEWGGFGTLIIALLYTFPLGVWDRFYLTSQAREDAQVANLRQLALEIAKLDWQWASAVGNIPTPDLQTMGLRSLGSQKVTLMTGQLDALREFQNRLTAPELALLAYAAAGMNLPELADDIYDTAFKKSEAEENIGLSADILRLRAIGQLNSTDGFDINRLRDLYGQSITRLSSVQTDSYILQTSFTLFTWAQLELTKGDWRCGETLADAAIQRISELPPLDPTVMQYQQQFSYSRNLISKTPNQANQGCTKQILELLK